MFDRLYFYQRKQLEVAFMKKNLFAPVILLLLCGCMIRTSDPAAERAFEVYHDLHIQLPAAPITLEQALGKTAPENHSAVRIAFAQIHILQNLHTPQAILTREKARIKLNTMLGYLPSDNIIYAEGTSTVCPAEIPHISAVEKTALILDDGQTPPLELLCKVRLAHADAAAAMNEAALDDSPEKRLNYVISCIRLAAAIGVYPEQLNDLGEFEKRFDSANARWRKSH